MSADLTRLESDLRAAVPGVRTELTTFASGAAMLDVWIGERFIVVQFSPDTGYVIDDDPDARPFGAGHSYASTDPQAVRTWLLAALARP